MLRFLGALLVLSAGAVVGTVLPVAGPHVAWARSCAADSVSVSASLRPEATAYKPGVWVARSATVANHAGADLADGRFDFVIGPNNQKMGAKPSVRWSIDESSWHTMSFYRTDIGMPVWRSDDNALPPIADGSKHTLRVSVAFAAASTEGSYFTELSIGSAACSLTRLGGTGNLNFGYLPSYAPKTTPPKSMPQPRTTHAGRATSSASPAVSQSPTVTLSPTLSLSQDAPSAAATSHAPQAVIASRSSALMIARLAAGVLAAFALPLAWMRWRRRTRQSRVGKASAPTADPTEGDIG